MANTTSNPALSAAKTIVVAGLLTVASPSVASTASTSIIAPMEISTNMTFDSKRRKLLECSYINIQNTQVETNDTRHSLYTEDREEINHIGKSIVGLNIASHIVNPQLKDLFSKFTLEQNKHPERILLDAEMAIFRFLAVASKVVKLPYLEGYVQLKEDNAFKFNLFFNNDIEVMLTSVFEADDEIDDDHVVYSVFKEDEVISSGLYEINTFVEAFPKYLIV